MSSGFNSPLPVVVALGSNLGDSVTELGRAFDELEKLSANALLRSSLWASAPLDCPPGSPDFVNAAALLHPLPRETPESFLGKLQTIEKDFGRRPKKTLNEARPLDLDIILWGDELIQTSTLIIPHPRAASRRFVMEPLAEILPDAKWPGTGRTVRQIRDAIRGSGQAIRNLC